MCMACIKYKTKERGKKRKKNPSLHILNYA